MGSLLPPGLSGTSTTGAPGPPARQGWNAPGSPAGGPEAEQAQQLRERSSDHRAPAAPSRPTSLSGDTWPGAGWGKQLCQPRAQTARTFPSLAGRGLPNTEPRSSSHILGNVFSFIAKFKFTRKFQFSFPPSCSVPTKHESCWREQVLPCNGPAAQKHEVSQPCSSWGQESCTYFQLRGMRNPHSRCSMSSWLR